MRQPAVAFDFHVAIDGEDEAGVHDAAGLQLGGSGKTW
jgi:hypothetical protein